MTSLKNTKKQDRTFFFLGIYFSILFICYIIHMFRTKSYVGLFWSCNIAPILFAIGFFTKNIQFIKGVINYIFPPNLGFMVATVVFALTSFPLFRINIAFDTLENGIMGVWIHLLSANIALLYTYKMKPLKKSIVYSVAIFFVVFLLTLILAPQDQNVNFLQSSKVLLGFDIPYVSLFWPFLVFFLMIFPTYLLQKFLYSWSQKKQKRQRFKNNQL